RLVDAEPLLAKNIAGDLQGQPVRREERERGLAAHHRLAALLHALDLSFELVERLAERVCETLLLSRDLVADGLAELAQLRGDICHLLDDGHTDLGEEGALYVHAVREAQR